jgi:hypothetical protein
MQRGAMLLRILKRAVEGSDGIRAQIFEDYVHGDVAFFIEVCSRSRVYACQSIKKPPLDFHAPCWAVAILVDIGAARPGIANVLQTWTKIISAVPSRLTTKVSFPHSLHDVSPSKPKIGKKVDTMNRQGQKLQASSPTACSFRSLAQTSFLEHALPVPNDREE